MGTTVGEEMDSKTAFDRAAPIIAAGRRIVAPAVVKSMGVETDMNEQW